MSIRLEHANMVVRDIDATLRFLQTAIPEFRVRREGKTWQGGRWVHVGTDDSYIAVNEALKEPLEAWVPYRGPVPQSLATHVSPGVGLRVDDPPDAYLSWVESTGASAS